MFFVEVEKQEFGLKPMNCPGERFLQVFRNGCAETSSVLLHTSRWLCMEL